MSVLIAFVFLTAGCLAQPAVDNDGDDVTQLQLAEQKSNKTKDSRRRRRNFYCNPEMYSENDNFRLKCCSDDEKYGSEEEFQDANPDQARYYRVYKSCNSDDDGVGGRRRRGKKCCESKEVLYNADVPSTTTTTAAWGPTCKVLHQDLVRIAIDAYEGFCHSDLCDAYGWNRIEDYSDNGHYAYLYQRISDGCRVLAFRGTDFSDFDEVAADADFYGYETMPTKEDSGNGGKDIKVYPGPEKAIHNLKELPSGSNVDYVTGHSLGGAMATLYSLRKGIPREQTVTFAAMATRYDDEHCTLPNSVRYANQDDPAVGNGNGLCLVPIGMEICATNAGGAWVHFNHDAEEVRAFFKYQENGNNLWKDCSVSSLCRYGNPSCSKKLNDASTDWNWHDSAKYKEAVTHLWPNEYR